MRHLLSVNQFKMSIQKEYLVLFIKKLNTAPCFVIAYMQMYRTYSSFASLIFTIYYANKIAYMHISVPPFRVDSNVDPDINISSKCM
jgi:hypothetical protein